MVPGAPTTKRMDGKEDRYESVSGAATGGGETGTGSNATLEGRRSSTAFSPNSAGPAGAASSSSRSNGAGGGSTTSTTGADADSLADGKGMGSWTSGG